MSYRKLLTKIYTSVILSKFIMADPTDIPLQKPGMDSVFSVSFRFTMENSDKEFSHIPQKMNRFFSKCDMSEDQFNNIFQDPATRTHIKTNSFDTMNNWYSNKILDHSVNDPTSPVGLALLKKIKKIPLYYMYKTEDYEFIGDSNDIAECLDYYWSEVNLCPPVKNWGHFFPDKAQQLVVIFKDTPCIFPHERSITGNDWTKISFDLFKGYAIPIPTPGDSAAATMFSIQVDNITIEMRDLSASTQHDKQEQECAKDIIDTAHVDFPADVEAVFKKVANRKWLWKLHIKVFNNPLTVNADGNVINKNYIELPKTHKTSLINKDGFDFRMLRYTFSQKLIKYLKAVMKFDNWSFVGYHTQYNGFCQTCLSHCVWVPTLNMYDATCDDVRGFICGDSSNAHLPASYKEFLKHWGLLIFQALN